MYIQKFNTVWVTTSIRTTRNALDIDITVISYKKMVIYLKDNTTEAAIFAKIWEYDFKCIVHFMLTTVK